MPERDHLAVLCAYETRARALWPRTRHRNRLRAPRPCLGARGGLRTSDFLVTDTPALPAGVSGRVRRCGPLRDVLWGKQWTTTGRRRLRGRSAKRISRFPRHFGAGGRLPPCAPASGSPSAATARPCWSLPRTPNARAWRRKPRPPLAQATWRCCRPPARRLRVSSTIPPTSAPGSRPRPAGWNWPRCAPTWPRAARSWRVSAPRSPGAAPGFPCSAPGSPS